MPNRVKLGVNIDHVATVRQARGGVVPDIIAAAKVAQAAGAYGITMHLREDRRHIQDADMFAVRKYVRFLNMEMAVVPEIIDIALKVMPDACCLVPEKREELTTEGGLDVIANFEKIKEATAILQDAGIIVSLFVGPDRRQLDAARDTGAEYVELHTGEYANTENAAQQQQLEILRDAAAYAQSIGLKVNAGHGLTYENVGPVAAIPGMQELNIGHNIIAQSVFAGLEQAVKQMLDKILEITRVSGEN
ncbi:MAG: pyridoxine 5'-phosphate synthase [Candidatus Margulisiibacteriota bacterium]